jgi:hypothetical protein
MNWHDYWSLAARLAAGSNEAEWRTAVSRAYYACFMWRGVSLSI